MLTVQHYTTLGFINEAVATLEITHPDAVARMTAFAQPLYSLGEDGSVTSKSTGKVMFWGKSAPAITRVSHAAPQVHHSANAFMIIVVHMGCTATPAYSEILPTTILDVIGDDASDLAVRYRRFVRITLVPLLRRVADILELHGFTIELPSKSWLETKYPEEPWFVQSADFYLRWWRQLVHGWERLLIQWADDDHSDHLPALHQLPWAGLCAIITWSLERGKQKQTELIGMTKADEEDMSQVWSAFFSGDTDAMRAAIANRAARDAGAPPTDAVAKKTTFEREQRSLDDDMEQNVDSHSSL
eukprot:SAG31_NODE_8355_length_1466_cov_2.194587_1_plen_301_part_00